MKHLTSVLFIILASCTLALAQQQTVNISILVFDVAGNVVENATVSWSATCYSTPIYSNNGVTGANGLLSDSFVGCDHGEILINVTNPDGTTASVLGFYSPGSTLHSFVMTTLGPAPAPDPEPDWIPVHKRF